MKNMDLKFTCSALWLICVFCCHFVSAAPSIVKVSESLITGNAGTWWDDRYGDAYLNAVSFNQDSLVSYKGWQYAVYYNQNRYVTVSRRQLPGGSWEHCVLSDYQQTTNDNHNTISMGISPADGRIHLAFDHHISNLHYRKSSAGLANNPAGSSWDASRFGAIESSLGGAAVTSFTYPAFILAPNNTLLMSGRVGTSGDGDNYIWKYNDNGSWTAYGKFVEGGGENAYFHGMCYDKNNRLHATWCWRATSSGTTNHDLLYAYSDDHGVNWKNNNGTLVGTANSNPIDPSKNCKIWTIGQNTGLINQEGMIVDAQNRVHVISREDESGTNYQIHYWRDTNGTWRRVNTRITTKIWDNRSKIVYDRDGNVYGILPDIQIAAASIASNYSDWAVIQRTDDGRFHHSEPLVDNLALSANNNELYVFVQQGTTAGTSGNLYALKYLLNASGTPTPTSTPAPTGKVGDVNNSGTVDIVDALMTAQFYVGLSPAGFDQSRADVNNDGKINIVDALMIAQYYVGLISGFQI